jgi:hypothetical protein
MLTPAYETHELITMREALKILTWVSSSGLSAGCRRTNELTRFPCGSGKLFSRQECEALRDSIIAEGNPQRRKFPKRQQRQPSITELV